MKPFVIEDWEVFLAIAQLGGLEIGRYVEYAIVGKAARPRRFFECRDLFPAHARRPLQGIHMAEIPSDPLGDKAELVGIEERVRGDADRHILDRVAGQANLGLEVAGAPLGPEFENLLNPAVLGHFRAPECEP